MAVAAAVVGVVLGAVGLYEQYSGAKKTQKLNEQNAQLSQQQSAASSRAEQARLNQMKLDSTRQQRQLYRQYTIARAHAASAAVASGTSGATNLQSSAFQGAQSQLGSQEGYGSGNISQNLETGSQIFAANQDIFNIQSQSAGVQSSIYRSQSDIDFGKTLFGLGQSFVQNADTTKNNYESIKSMMS